MLNLNNYKLMTRLSIGVLLAIVAMVVITWSAVGSMRKLIYEDREIKTRHLVEVAHSIASHFHGLQKAGKYSEDEARAEAIKTIKAFRYEEKEYFWINDLGKPVPKMVMHAVVPALEGKVLDEARFNKATSKRLGNDGAIMPLDKQNLFVAFVDTVEAAGHGFVTYLWPKAKQGGGVTEELFLKLSYVKKFEPWGWVIGTGIYIDDVDQIFWEHAKRSLMLTVIVALLLFAVSWLVRRSILREFGGEPRVAMAAAGRMANGDLTGKIDLAQGDNSSVLYVLKHMQTSLKDMLVALRNNALHVEKSIQQLSGKSSQMAQAAQLQATSVGQTRSAVDQVAQRVVTVSELAHDTEHSSQEVLQQARNGAALVDRVAGEMGKIAATVKSSSEEVSHLVDSTRKIESMANVIKEIADQTNLLALNAAIEAARAGEQGRGFAVVADEVRKLAERTTKATQEIGDTLQGVHTNTVRAVDGMNATAPIIAGGVEQANQAAATLREIEQQSRHALERMNQLTEATGEQTANIQQIVGNIDEVNKASAQTEEVVRQSMQSTAELNAAANAMFDLVKRFKVD